MAIMLYVKSNPKKRGMFIEDKPEIIFAKI